MRQSTRSPLDPAPPCVVSMIGNQYGRLTVIAFAGWRYFPSGARNPEIYCACSCGNSIKADCSNVRSGHTTSCGCASSRHKRTQLRHGHMVGKKPSHEYRVWRDMNNRCNRPTTKAYHSYGGRGIAVCERWMEGIQGAFDRFLSDMGLAPSASHSIDRKDVNGNYEPGNCRWATRYEQVRNTRRNRWITAFGRTQIMADWARELGVHPMTIYNWVVRRGLTLEDMVANP